MTRASPSASRPVTRSHPHGAHSQGAQNSSQVSPVLPFPLKTQDGGRRGRKADPTQVPPSALQRGQAGLSHRQGPGSPRSCPHSPAACSLPTNEAGLSVVSPRPPQGCGLLRQSTASHCDGGGPGPRGPSEALPRRNGLVCSAPALPHPLGSPSPPPALAVTDGAPTSSPRGAGRNPSLASSSPAPAGPELHRAWGPGGLRKRKWRPWDEGRAGRPEKPYSVPRPGPCAHLGQQSAAATTPRARARPTLGHPSAPARVDFPFAERVSH